MQIILSRKGFDSKNGGQPSPILPDGTILTLPIPAKDGTILFSDLKHKGKTYFEIITELKPNSKIKENYTCHLDPDLKKDITKRDGKWAPLFGQHGGSQTHLKNEGVKKGDLFLFFGWFKETEYQNGRMTFKKNAIDLHVLFGYLQVGAIFSDISLLPKEFKYHPHAQKKFLDKKNNNIYKASETLSFLPSIDGAGCFNFNEELILTKKGHTRGRWALPFFFRNIKISHHNKNSFVDDYFQSAPIGQEFVIEENDEVTEWAKNIIIKGTKTSK